MVQLLVPSGRALTVHAVPLPAAQNADRQRPRRYRSRPAGRVVGAPAGRLLSSLAQAGLAPDDIDVVVLTHAHPDHIGGLVSDDHLTFERARHVMSAAEWRFWTSEPTWPDSPRCWRHPPERCSLR